MKPVIFTIVVGALFGGWTVSAQEAEVPPATSKLVSSFNSKCSEFCGLVIAEYKKQLQGLLQKYVALSDFDMCKSLKAELEIMNTTPDSLWKSTGSSLVIPGQWLEKATKLVHALNADGSHLQAKLHETLSPSGDSINTELSEGDILVFRSEINRLWFRYEPDKICQFSKWGKTDLVAEAPAGPGGKELDQLKSEYAGKCARLCMPLYRKYLAALEQQKKQAVARGDLDGAIAINNLINETRETLERGNAASASKWPDPRFMGSWKEINGGSWLKVDSSRAANYSNKDLSYVRSSERGNIHSFRTSNGEVHALALIGKELHMFCPGSGWHISFVKDEQGKKK